LIHQRIRAAPGDYDVFDAIGIEVAGHWSRSLQHFAGLAELLLNKCVIHAGRLGLCEGKLEADQQHGGKWDYSAQQHKTYFSPVRDLSDRASRVR
jgi:hypothetical protein